MLRKHFTDELELVRQDLVQMGETAIDLLSEALGSIVESSPERSARASQLEAQTDHQHRMIHDKCLSLITLQAPVASDARLITNILDAIVDLELIGDYAYEIVDLSSSIDARPPSEVLSQITEAGGKIRQVLQMAIESWRHRDAAQAVAVRPLQSAIRSECEGVYQKLSQLVGNPPDGIAYVDLMLICKHLERILRHAVSVADQAADAAPAARTAS